MAELLLGKPCADQIKAETAKQVELLQADGIQPRLQLVRVGERADDIRYEASIIKQAGRLGIKADALVLPAAIGEETAKAALEDASANPAVHGIMIFRPLPQGLNESAILESIDPVKDVDGATRGSMATVYAGQGKGFAPCTPAAVLALLEHYQIPLAGTRSVVVGRSPVVGRPAALLLLAANSTVTVAHSRTRELAGVTREADIVVAALGKERFLGAEYFAEEQVVIDVGIHVDAAGELCGDVDFTAVEGRVRAISPAKGGVGVVTTAILLRNVLTACHRLHGKDLS